MAKGKVISSVEREWIGRLLKLAADGKDPRMYKSVLAAGFAPKDFGKLRGRDIAALWGISEMAVSHWHSRDGCPRNPDKTWHLPSVIAFREERFQEANNMASTAPSPALERWREESARMAELKRKAMEASLVPLTEMKAWLGRLALILRNGQEVLQRIHGNEAADIVREALEEWESELEKEWQTSQNAD